MQARWQVLGRWQAGLLIAGVLFGAIIGFATLGEPFDPQGSSLAQKHHLGSFASYGGLAGLIAGFALGILRTDGKI